MPMVAASESQTIAAASKTAKRPQNFVQASARPPLLKEGLRLGDSPRLVGFLYEHGLQLGDFLKDALCVLIEHLALLGRRHAAVQPVEKARVGELLEPLDT